jgi:Thiolase, N-terminal domain
VTISVDDGIRPETTLAGLAKLKAVFKKDGSTTAGKLYSLSILFYYIVCDGLVISNEGLLKHQYVAVF